MLFLLFAVLIISFLLLGNGVLLSSIIRLVPVRNPFLYFWFGIFSTSVLAMFASFFVPINYFALLIFAILGIIGLPRFITEMHKDFNNLQCWTGTLFMLFSLSVIFSICCIYSYITPNSNFIHMYDTALYHANAVQWLNEYGAVFGLGNLHYRLGMNSSWLTFAAVFDNFMFDGKTAFLLKPLWLIGGFLFFGYEFCKTNSRRIAVFCIVILSFLALQMIRSQESILGLYFDTIVFVVYAVMILETFYLLSENKLQNNIPVLSCILILSVFAFMLKQIGAINCIFTFALALYFLLFDKKLFFENSLKVFLPAGTAFVVMLINNCILSGYLLFPLPILAMPFDWTMPKELVQGCYNAVIYWARLPGPLSKTCAENGFWYWFKPWLLRHNTKLNLFVYFLPFVVSIILWIKIILSKKDKSAVFFFLWSITNIAFWFKTAPDLRFGSGFFFVNLALSLMFFISDGDNFIIKYFHKNIYRKRLICFLFIFVIIAEAVVFYGIKSNFSILTINKMGTNGVREYVVQNVEYKYKVFIPNNGDQVGNSPIPATPYPNLLEKYGIEMRNNKSFGNGFRPKSTYVLLD